MAAIGQERIEIGTNLRLRIAPKSPDAESKKLPETDTQDKRDSLAGTGKLIAFAQDCTVNFEQTLTPTNNKDSGIYASSIVTMKSFTVEASFMTPQWAVTAEDGNRLNVVDWLKVWGDSQYLWVTFGTAEFKDGAIDPVHIGSLARAWALMSNFSVSAASHEVATTNISLQSTGIVYLDSVTG